MFVVRKIIPFAERHFPLRSRILGGVNTKELRGFVSDKPDLPPPPKRPLTAYLAFCKENRNNILKDNPDLPTSEQTKLLAEKWSNLSPSARKIYEDTARQSVIAYAQAHKKFYENLTEEQREELSKLKAQKKEARKTFRLKRLLKESGVPKPPSSAYTLFLQAEAKERYISSLPEFNKAVAAAWHSLPHEKRQYYVDQAKKEKQVYESQMKTWREKLASEGQQALLQAYDESQLKTKNAVSQSSQSKASKKRDKSVEK